MSTLPTGSQTEYLADLYNRHSLRDLDNQQREIDLGRGERTYTDSILLPALPTRQTNEPFHSTDSTPAEFEFRPLADTGEAETEEPVEEAERQFGLLTRQAAEVAAAARFISNVDIVVVDQSPRDCSQIPRRPRLGSITGIRDSILASSLTVPKSRSNRMQAHSTFKRRQFSVPPALQLSQSHDVAEDVQTQLPARVSSRGAPSFDVARPPLSRSITSPAVTMEPKTPLSILTPESANTFQFDFSIPAEPPLSRSGSGATTDSQSPPTPVDDAAEEKIRREIEAFALEQGPHLRGSQRRTRRPARTDDNVWASPERARPLPLEHEEVKQAEAFATDPGSWAFPEDEDTSPGHSMRRKRSLFGWLQKRQEIEVDELIDLYLTDEQREDAKVVKRKHSRGRLGAFRNRVTTDPLPLKGG